MVNSLYKQFPVIKIEGWAVIKNLPKGVLYL